MNKDMTVNIGLGQVVLPGQIARVFRILVCVVGVVAIAAMLAGGGHAVHGGTNVFRVDIFIASALAMAGVLGLFSLMGRTPRR